MTQLQSALYTGKVYHRRLQPTEHAFSYRVLFWYIDLVELESGQLNTLLNGCRWWSPTRFHRKNYHGDARESLLQAVQRTVIGHTGQSVSGPVRVLTQPTYWGYHFNPVSIYFCVDKAGARVETVVAEVTNTPWGERHTYVLPRPSHTDGQNWSVDFDKAFHVSPFMPLDQSYRWHFQEPGAVLANRLTNQMAGETVFEAGMKLQRHPLTARERSQQLLREPAMTIKTTVAIYFEALRLALKRVPVYSHPQPNTRNH